MTNQRKPPYAQPMSETTPGWYPDPNDPGSVIYFDGEGYSGRAPAPAKPPSAWKQIRIVAIGVLVALVCAVAIYQMTAPSDVDCSFNDLDRSLAQAKGETAPAKLDRCP